MLNGIILIDKPEGFTSFDVIAKMRGILKQKKLGHSGTLDPMATGVLPVFAGNAAKAISIMPKTGKGYTAGFRLGIATDTYDITGTVTEQNEVNAPEAEVFNILSKFRGKITQLPPMYSAVKVEGKRLYELARKGVDGDGIKRPERTVEIDRLELTAFDGLNGTLEISCSRGTYVRSIIHDMGRSLGCGAVMTSLVRTRSDGFRLDECVTLEQLQRMSDENRLDGIAVPVEKLFMSCPEIRFTEKQTVHYKNGVKQSVSQFKTKQDSGLFRVYGSDGAFIGIAEAADGLLKVCKNLCGETG